MRLARRYKVDMGLANGDVTVAKEDRHTQFAAYSLLSLWRIEWTLKIIDASRACIRCAVGAAHQYHRNGRDAVRM